MQGFHLVPAAFLGCLHDTRLHSFDHAICLGPVNAVPRQCVVGQCTRRLPVHLLSSPQGSCRLSRDERPVGSLPTFVSGNISTRIHAITARHSLSPTSFTHSANSFPCGRPAQGAARWAYPVPLSQRDGDGSLFTPATQCSACVHNRLSAPDRIAFALSLTASLAGLYSRRLREFTFINHATRALPAPALMLAGVASASRLGLGLSTPVGVLDAPHPAVTGDARSSRLLLAEQQVLSDCYRQDSCDSDLQVAPV